MNRIACLIALILLGFSGPRGTCRSEEPPIENGNPSKSVSELGDLAKQALERAKAGDYLRAHVALQRIEELRRFGDKRYRGDAISADELANLKQLAEDVAAHIDLKEVEYHDGYVLYRKSSDENAWTEPIRSLKGPRGLLAMRIFLEDPSLEDAIQLQGKQGCQMFKLESTSQGVYVQIADGEPAVVSRAGSGLCCFSIGTLRHASPSIEARIPAKEVTVLGDIVLLRPNEGTTGNLEILLDAGQAESSGPVKPRQNEFILGRITAGGKFGKSIIVSDGTSYSFGPCSPGKVWIVWAANPRQRWQVDVTAGQTTLVRFALEANGKLAEPKISRTPTASDNIPSQP